MPSRHNSALRVVAADVAVRETFVAPHTPQLSTSHVAHTRPEADAPRPTQAEVEAAVRTLLAAYDDDPNREGLADTPRRVAKMYAEILTPPAFDFTVFNAENADQMIVERRIPFYSLCEHHMAPFYGFATVAYIPDGKIAGLSKLARAVDHFARRLQNQERLTVQVADLLVERLAPLGVGVVMQATHLCMAMRGVEKQGALTVTSALRGAMLTDPKARDEFLRLAYAIHGDAQ